MQVGDFLKVTVGWQVPASSAPVLNVWDFKCVQFDEPTELQVVGPFIAAAFVGIYLTPIVARLSTQVQATSLSLRNYADDSEGWDGQSIYAQGTSATPILPPFVTFSLRGQRRDYNIRNARKGIPGATTSALASDGTVASATLASWAVHMDGWQDTFYVEAGANELGFEPRIVRQPTTPNTNPTVSSTITAWTCNRAFGTQNSRK